MPVFSSQERIGTVIGGKYAISRLIGEGGMGAVFEAEHRMTRRRVAVKLLQPEMALNGDAVARFVQEAHAATAIAHPNIVQVLDMGTDETGAVYLVLEFLSGEDFGARLSRERRVALPAALEVLVPVMDALSVAHAKGIVHRDLKPANIFLARQDNGQVVPKLLDFGISKITGQNALAHTATGAVLGTAHYMAPEQARGAKDLDHGVDVWAMGVVLYQSLSGALPFEGENYNEMIIKLVTEEPVPLAQRAPWVDPSVAAVVMQALSKDRARRVPTIRDLATALTAVAQGAPHTGSYQAPPPGAPSHAAPAPSGQYTRPPSFIGPTPTGQYASPPSMMGVPAGTMPPHTMPPGTFAPGAQPSTNMAWHGNAAATGMTAPNARNSRAGLLAGVGFTVVVLAGSVVLGLRLQNHSVPVTAPQSAVRPVPPAPPPPVQANAAPTPPAPVAPVAPVAPAAPEAQPDGGAAQVAATAPPAADATRTGSTRGGHARAHGGTSSSSGGHGMMLQWGER